MANLNNLGLDPNVAEASGFKLIQPGKYRAVIISDDLKDTNKGDGKKLEVVFQLIDQPNKGHEIKTNLNIINPSSKAQAIGQGQLKRLCNLTKVEYPPADTRKMYGIPMIIDVDFGEEFESKNNPGKMLKSNEIKGFYPDSGAPVAPQPAQAQPSQAAASAW